MTITRVVFEKGIELGSARNSVKLEPDCQKLTQKGGPCTTVFSRNSNPVETQLRKLAEEIVRDL